MSDLRTTQTHITCIKYARVYEYICFIHFCYFFELELATSIGLRMRLKISEHKELNSYISNLEHRRKIKLNLFVVCEQGLREYSRRSIACVRALTHT